MRTIWEKLLEQRERDGAIDVLELLRCELRRSQTQAWILGLIRLADEDGDGDTATTADADRPSR